MQKITLFALILSLVLFLASCGKSADAGSESADAPESSSEVIEPEEPEETELEETTEETEPEETDASKGGTATIVTDGGPDVEVSDQNNIRGGTNQDDAVLLPLNTKLYGTASDSKAFWYAFTTETDADVEYTITAINKSGDGYIGTFIYDDAGGLINKFPSPLYYGSAHQTIKGKAATMTLSDLEPNTVYYIRMAVTDSRIYYDVRGGTVAYMLKIESSSKATGAYATADTLQAARGKAAALDGEIIPGQNQDDAAYIPTDVKIAGTIRDSVSSWFAFTTNGTAGTYEIETLNKTPESNYLGMFLSDEGGGEIGKSVAGSDGKKITYSTDMLLPNTTYYIMLTITSSDAYYLDREGTIDYTLQINAPEEPEQATATIEQPEEQLVFETPFELNETQVMFVANKAEFIDEAAAKEALKPVADAILAHPDANILIAGTTATDGTQESCVKLSNKRAEAVKDLLVSSFGVPESQIQTIGLGYADDPFVRGQDRVPAGDVNGKFVESEGAKNRRVVILDVNDPIAQELLNR